MRGGGRDDGGRDDGELENGGAIVVGFGDAVDEDGADDGANKAWATRWWREVGGGGALIRS